MRAQAEPTATREEYLQAIWTIADESGPVIGVRLADFLGVTPASVSEMVHRLQREGLVTLNPRKEIGLTERGGELATGFVRRHRLVERMLTDMLGYPWWQTHEEAERIEHAISPEMERRLVERLGNPDTCPHGNPMPGIPRRPSQPLAQAAPREPLVLERIPDQFEHEPGFLRYVDAQGLHPGIGLRLVERPTAEGVVIEVDGTVRTLRADCGAKLWVRSA